MGFSKVPVFLCHPVQYQFYIHVFCQTMSSTVDYAVDFLAFIITAA